jgi:RNA polymerase sigma-70 factor (ECF subfamily)
VANHARSERRRERLHLEAGNTSRQPEAEPTTTEGALLEALASLPAKDQEALLLVAWEGLDHRRAAAAAGVSRVAFAARYARARRRLERAMATRAADAPPRPVTDERRSDLAS